MLHHAGDRHALEKVPGMFAAGEPSEPLLWADVPATLRHAKGSPSGNLRSRLGVIVNRINFTIFVQRSIHAKGIPEPMFYPFSSSMYVHVILSCFCKDVVLQCCSLVAWFVALRLAVVLFDLLAGICRLSWTLCQSVTVYHML